MKIIEMKRKHADMLGKIRELSKEDRSLSEEQEQELDTLYTECSDLKNKIEKRERLKELEVRQNDVDFVPDKEKRQYSLVNAVKCLVTGKHEGYEAELHREYEKRGVSVSREGNFLIPTHEIFGKPLETRVVDNQSALVSKPMKPELYLPALFENSIVDKLGLRRISATGSFKYPRASKTTAAWFTGDGGSATEDSLTEQDPTFTSVDVAPKFLGAITGWTLRQLKQMLNNLSLESLLRDNLARSMAEKLDDTLVNGDSTTRAYEPNGIIRYFSGTNKNESAELDFSSTVAWTWATLTDALMQLRVKYKMNSMSPKWLIGPQIEKEWNDKQRFASSDGQSLLDEAPGGVVVSNHLPNTHAIIGQWSEFSLVTFDTVELSLGMINDDFKKGIQRLRAIGCFEFFIDREKEAFYRLKIKR